MDARSVFLIYILLVCAGIYTCAGGFAGGYLHPAVCTHTAIALALHLRPVTAPPLKIHTHTHTHYHTHTRKHTLPLVRTFARIDRGFLKPLAAVRV